MTEAQWLTCTKVWEMIQHIRNTSERKLKLFSCACCRRIWAALKNSRSRAAVEVTEQFLEEATNNDEWEAAKVHARAVFDETPDDPENFAAILPLSAGWPAAASTAALAQEASAFHATRVRNSDEWARAQHTEEAAQADLIRNIFGNLFRPAAFSPSWRTSTALALASQMYESRDFSAIPILTDALQDAGCDNDDILGHCRGPGPHVRGCWVVDLVLGKE